MSVERGLRASLRYRWDEFLSSGAGRQLLLLFVLSMLIVLVHTGVALGLALPVGDSFPDKFWFYFARILDAGTMGGDQGTLVRVVSTVDTILGVIVAGLLISALAGNFQERLEAIKRGGSIVMERGHFVVLGWSDKVFSVVDQLSEANVEQGRIVVVVMAERDKLEMEEKLRDKLVHLDRIKLVVRSGNSVTLNDLSRVSIGEARAVVVLLDEGDLGDPNRADGRVIKTLMAIYNHPDLGARAKDIKVAAEVVLSSNREIAEIASGHRAQVVNTNEIISKIILQTSRVSGLSVVYDELLRFEGNEIHYARFPEVAGKRFGDVLLDFPNGCVVGVAKADGSSHQLNPAADHPIQPDEELLIVAEDDHIRHAPYAGPLKPSHVGQTSAVAERPVEHMLVLGWNEKVFPIVKELDEYVGAGSTLTLVNGLETETCQRLLGEHCGRLERVHIEHLPGEFTSRALMERLQPQNYPTVMVLGDSSAKGGSEGADTRAIIALLLLRDFRRRAGVARQKVCSEILDPKNRELAATTEIHDIVISNEMVSMVLAQVAHEPRVRPVLEDLFQSEGSEVYLKDLALYVPLGQPTSFEYLLLAAKARNEVAFGLQIRVEGPRKRHGIVLNPADRRSTFTPKAGDRLVVLAEDDG